MPRRFLTAEDVRRSGGGPMEVAPETVVTPHARQTAEELGVRLVTGSAVKHFNHCKVLPKGPKTTPPGFYFDFLQDLIDSQKNV